MNHFIYILRGNNMAMYFDNLYEGYRFETGKRRLSKEDLISLAKEWD